MQLPIPLLYTTDHIFSRILETPINAYDAETVILVHDFTVIGIKANVRDLFYFG